MTLSFRFTVFLVLLGVAVPLRAALAAATTQPIDVLDYFLQSDDVHQDWTIGGWDVQPAPDPDGAGARTIVLNKFSQPGVYEVYKVTPTELQCRYEVMRIDRQGSAADWIRRFQEKGPGHGKYPGQLWMPRYVVPGKTHFLSHADMDRYIFDPNIHSYIYDGAHSSDHTVCYGSVVWATDNWGKNNQTGMHLNPVLRLISQWQDQGKIFECYDYSRGRGLVNWQWLERLSTLRPVQRDSTGRAGEGTVFSASSGTSGDGQSQIGNPKSEIREGPHPNPLPEYQERGQEGRLFYCEGGAVEVVSRGSADQKPVVFKYDLKKHRRGRQLEVIRFTSYWKPRLGPQWYVVYRDLAREQVLKLKHERMPIDYKLPEWTCFPGATIADLPGVNTRRAPAR